MMMGQSSTTNLHCFDWLIQGTINKVTVLHNPGDSIQGLDPSGKWQGRGAVSGSGTVGPFVSGDVGVGTSRL